MAHLFTSALLFPFILFFMSFISSSFSDHLSSSFVPTYWSENVNNKMPTLISSKISPLTKQESDYYTKIISQKNFKADSNFCSLAKLACSTKIDKVKVGHLLSQNQYGYQNNGLMPLDSNVDPFSFFRSSILKEKNTIHLPNLKESVSFRSFLPPQIASKFSLTTDQLTKIFPMSSKEAIDITISSCNSEMKGETKACLKSLEEMISFSKNTLGTSKVLALNSISTIGSTKLVTIKKIKQFNVEEIVACHEMFLPFSTYLCHSVSSSRIYSVELVEPKRGTPVSTAIAVCHMDTSDWSEHHVAFKILKVGPGQSEACHWVNENGLAWVASGKNI